MTKKDDTLRQIYSKIRLEERITPNEGLILLKDAPWLELAQLAWEKRVKKVGGDKASYTLFRIINYTNVCDIGCCFCSFKRTENDKMAYVLTKDEVLEKVEASKKIGIEQIFFQGGVHPNLPLSYYTDILKAVKSDFGVHIRGFSPVEILRLAELNQMTVPKMIGVLKRAGLDSVPGAGAEILSERVRAVLSPNKCSTAQWARIIKQCHQQGLPGSANIVIGSIEKDREIIAHLSLVRKIQDETQGFNSFIPWTFQRQTKDFYVKNILPHDYLKLVSLCRIFLDNIRNLEVSVLVLGEDIGKLALRMGANDISSPVIEENVLRSFGIKSEREAQNLIQEAGFTAVKRDFNYRPLEVFPPVQPGTAPEN
ncbi:MAG: CofH family radical SAM protein [Deltaproteobacteria bacterium]|nr:CofH family radical SAM protein [Deltaproteobacteria bacterium]